MIEELRKKNEELLMKYSNNLEKAKEYTRQIIIQEVLKDENFASKLEMEVAYAILKDLQVKEDKLDAVYLSLLN